MPSRPLDSRRSLGDNGLVARLIRLSEEYRDSFLEMAEEWRVSGDDRYAEGRENFGDYVRRLRDHERSIGLPQGFVPATTLWLVEDLKVIGRGSIRHRLTPQLERIGGHIGYDVRPSERRKGYGNLILALTLVEARALGLQKILVTCDDDNLASARIIEKNGGVLWDADQISESGKRKRRYWITL